MARASSRGRTSECDKFASTVGSDWKGNGTLRSPFRTLAQLDQSLSPGQTGCLEGGTYGSFETYTPIDASGASDAPITVRSAPGEVATVVGFIDIKASYTTVEDLRIDGTNTLYPQHPPGVNCRDHVSEPLSITGDNDVLQHVDYFQSVPALNGNAIGVGFDGGGDNTIIRYNKIHDVGGCDFYDHLIYLAGGSGAQIYDNWMWDDPHGWGIKLDPGPTDARIWDNVIDRAGSGFNFGNSSGNSPTADNQVFDNIVMDSVGVSNPDIHYYHRGVLVTSAGMLSASTGNEVFDNDSYRNPGGVADLAHDLTPAQLSVTNNRHVAPQFVDAAAHDFTLRATQASTRRRKKHRRRRSR